MSQSDVTPFRRWVYTRLINDPVNAALVGDRVFLGESMGQAPAVRPFEIYRFGNASPDDNVRVSDRQYFTVYCHDDSAPNSYTRKVDAMVDAVKRALDEQSSRAHGVIVCRYLETSADFDDRELKTILRYVRFQLIVRNHRDE